MRHDQLLDSREVCDFVGLNWGHVLAMLRAGTFPMPVKDTGRRIRWWQDELTGWMAARR